MSQTKDVLVVDDDKQILKVLQMYLNNMGCFANIVLAQDGITASNKLNNQKFDLILLDLNLPKKSGLEIIKEIAENKRSVNALKNIIVVSGTLEKDKIEKILGFGVKHFLVKPFDEEHFQEKVLKVMTTK